MADEHDHPSKRTRTAPPPFVGPPRGGALAPKTRVDRPTLPPFSPPFSPPFVKRPSPGVPVVRNDEERAVTPAPSPPSAPMERTAPSWLDAPPNEPTAAPASVAEVGSRWVNPDEPPAVAPAQMATGIEWLDSPATEGTTPTTTSKPSAEELDDVFGWDPAEERGPALDAAPPSVTLDALKEIEPWALPGAEPSAMASDDVAAALERVAARIRSGHLFVPAALTPTTDEAMLASVLAALLQRARG
jgi:hypothetical protein